MDCTYKEISEFIECNSLQRENEFKEQIILMDELGNKLINALAFGSKHPRNDSLVTKIYSDLFKKELEKEREKMNEPQSIEEQIANMRSWG